GRPDPSVSSVERTERRARAPRQVRRDPRDRRSDPTPPDLHGRGPAHVRRQPEDEPPAAVRRGSGRAPRGSGRRHDRRRGNRPRVGRRGTLRVEGPQQRVPRPAPARPGDPHGLPWSAGRGGGEADQMTSGRPTLLALEDGSVFRGTGFGAPGESFGEAVFNTAMAGYQEVLTDPSYAGQIVTMTSPHQGNYGVNDEDAEGGRIQVAGCGVREVARRAST